MISDANEPRVIHAATRVGTEDIHIECHFSDGQKFCVATVDGEFPVLAQSIVDFLNAGVEKK